MIRHLCLASVFAASLFFHFQSVADTNSGSVLVETPDDYTKPYKQRRGTHGALLSLFSESFDPFNYQSGYGGTDALIGDFLGSTEIRLNGIEIGYKYNISIASVAALFSYSTGNAENAGHQLGFTKKSFSANAALDAVFDEPYVVPYGQFSVNLFDITEEKTGADSFSESTSPLVGFRYGVLFQLDWIENYLDKEAKAERLFSSGLESTYIDLYYANYLAASNAQDPSVIGSEGEGNLESSGQMGIGLKMEF